MRGEVQIWEGNNLLLSEPNMLVDGAGELLADVMTVSPSLSAVNAHCSGIADASNYTIQAISFGTGSDAFRNNAHRSDGAARQSLWASVTQSTGMVIQLYESSALHPFVGSGKRSYEPIAGLPHAPDPALTTLDKDTSVSAIVGGIAVSSVFPGNGQLTNFIPSGIFSSVMDGTAFDNGVSATVAAMTLGCFTAGSASPPYPTLTFVNTYKTNLDGSVAEDAGANTRTSVQYAKGSFFNECSSMDVSGFVNMCMSASPYNITGTKAYDYTMSSMASGLCVSGAHGPQATDPEFGIVEYSVMISADDLATANAYGGIYHLGLWTIDVQQSLLNGNTPPFAFSVLNNPRKYKLFARKGLSKNLCFITDKSTTAATGGNKNYKDLIIKWRLHFV